MELNMRLVLLFIIVLTNLVAELENSFSNFKEKRNELIQSLENLEEMKIEKQKRVQKISSKLENKEIKKTKIEHNISKAKRIRKNAIEICDNFSTCIEKAKAIFSEEKILYCKKQLNQIQKEIDFTISEKQKIQKKLKSIEKQIEILRNILKESKVEIHNYE
jgi:chromosome segregation ATPase